MAWGYSHFFWQHSSLLHKLWLSWGMIICGPVLARGQGQLRSNLGPEPVGGGGQRREMCNTSITGINWGHASDPRVNKLVWASPLHDLQLHGFIGKGLSESHSEQGQQTYAWPSPLKRQEGLITSTLEDFVFLLSSLIFNSNNLSFSSNIPHPLFSKLA